MKRLITDYQFDPLNRRVTFSERINLESLLLITNVTTNQIIYNFADSTSGGINQPGSYTKIVNDFVWRK